LKSLPKELQRKLLCKASSLLATEAGKGNKERKYVGMLERTLLMRVILPPFERYAAFQPESLLKSSNHWFPNSFLLKFGSQRKAQICYGKRINLAA